MSRTARLRVLCGGLAIVAMAFAAPANAVICTIGPDGNLPPQCFGGDGYLSPDDVHHIIMGLPPGNEILIGAEHFEFFNISRGSDGTGGEIENFQSILNLHMQTSGPDLPPYNRFLTMQTQDQTHVGPDTDGRPHVRSHDTEFLGLQGQLPPGDPDFDLLRVTAGSTFGMPSPGHTTLARQPGGNWAVDSFFDITYRIDFEGAPGGPFAGMSGSTTGTIRMQVGEHIPEPTTLCLFGLGLVGTLGMARRSR